MRNNSNRLFYTIHSHPGIIPVLNRLGVRLGVGEMSLEEAVLLSGVEKSNIPFIDSLIDYYTGDESVEIFKSLQMNGFIEGYFKKTAEYFRGVQMPNIEKHLNAFIGMSMATDTSKGQLIQLGRLLKEFSEAMGNCFNFSDMQSVTQCEDLLNEMQLVMIKYLNGSFNDNLCHATIFALHSLETDIKRHRLLLNAIESDCKETEICNRYPDNEYPESIDTPLTAREREVLILVAQGKLNKEIADELNISFQTVLSHRKNISSKLGIKTVAGLIFYAIRANLINI